MAKIFVNRIVNDFIFFQFIAKNKTKSDLGDRSHGLDGAAHGAVEGHRYPAQRKVVRDQSGSEMPVLVFRIKTYCRAKSRTPKCYRAGAALIRSRTRGDPVWAFPYLFFRTSSLSRRDFYGSTCDNAAIRRTPSVTTGVFLSPRS